MRTLILLIFFLFVWVFLLFFFWGGNPPVLFFSWREAKPRSDGFICTEQEVTCEGECVERGGGNKAAGAMLPTRPAAAHVGLSEPARARLINITNYLPESASTSSPLRPRGPSRLSAAASRLAAAARSTAINAPRPSFPRGAPN